MLVKVWGAVVRGRAEVEGGGGASFAGEHWKGAPGRLNAHF